MSNWLTSPSTKEENSVANWAVADANACEGSWVLLGLAWDAGEDNSLELALGMVETLETVTWFAAVSMCGGEG